MSKVSYKVGEYNNGDGILPKGSFRISPSGAAKFFTEKRNWYGENLLGEPKKFKGSSSSAIGNLVHNAAEIVAECQIHNETYDSEKLAQASEDYINSLDDDELYDTSVIRQHWRNMAEPLIKEFVVGTNTLMTEEFMAHELLNGIYVGGSMDAVVSSSPTDTWEDALAGKEVGQLTVRDWKTSGSLVSSMNWAYTIQAYIYAYLLRQKGVNITQVELCFTIRPTKTLPVRTRRFVKPFNDTEYTYIEGILKLIAESVQCFQNYEDLQYLLACDYRLKKNDIPLP